MSEPMDELYKAFVRRLDVMSLPSLTGMSIDPIIRSTVVLSSGHGVPLKNVNIDGIIYHGKFHLKIIGAECLDNFSRTVYSHLKDHEILAIVAHGSQFFITEMFMINRMLADKDISVLEIHGVDHDYQRFPKNSRVGMHNTHLDLPQMPWDATISMFVWPYPNDCYLGYKNRCNCELNYAQNGCHDYHGLRAAVEQKTKFIVIVEGVDSLGERSAGTELFAELVEHIIKNGIYKQILKMTWPEGDRTRDNAGMVIGRLLRLY